MKKSFLLVCFFLLFSGATCADVLNNLFVPVSPNGDVPSVAISCATGHNYTLSLVHRDGDNVEYSYGVQERRLCSGDSIGFDGFNLNEILAAREGDLSWWNWTHTPVEYIIKDSTNPYLHCGDDYCPLLNLEGDFNLYDRSVYLASSTYYATLGAGPVFDTSDNGATWFNSANGDGSGNYTPADNVLFLPGIEASRLYRTGSGDAEQRLWEPTNDGDVSDIELREDGEPYLGDDVYTRDVVDQAYGVFNIYKSFLDELSQMKSDDTIADYSAVAYDWRLSLDDILRGGTVTGTGDSEQISYTAATGTPFIESELRRLASTSKSGKVTIVAHSNGGLVAKALMMRLTTEDPDLLAKVDKIIFVAVPQLGTPEAIAALLHGTEQGIPSFFPLWLSEHEAREFAHNSETAYNLLPSNDYFTYVDTPVVTFDDSLPDWQAKYGSTDSGKYFGAIHSEELLQNFLTDTYGRVSYSGVGSSDTDKPDSLSPTLLSEAEAEHALLDSWSAPATTKIFEIAGWGVPSTMSGITYENEETDCVLVVCSAQITPEPNWTIDGDSVVVTPSALWMSGQNVQRYWVDLKDYDNDHQIETLRGFFPFDHKKILEVDELDTFIQQIITNQPLATLPQYISSTQPIAGTNDTRLIFALTSDSLDAYNESGDHTGISTSTGQVEENIPGTSVVQVGDTSYLFSDNPNKSEIIITPDPDQSVNQDDNTNDNGAGNATSSAKTTKKVKHIKLKVEKISGDTPTESATYEIVTDSASTTAEMTVSNNDISSDSSLVVDINGDGQDIVTLPPEIDSTVTFVDPDISTSTEEATTTLPTDTTDQNQATTTETTDDNSNGTASTTPPSENQNLGTGQATTTEQTATTTPATDTGGTDGTASSTEATDNSNSNASVTTTSEQSTPPVENGPIIVAVANVSEVSNGSSQDGDNVGIGIASSSPGISVSPEMDEQIIFGPPSEAPATTKVQTLQIGQISVLATSTTGAYVTISFKNATTSPVAKNLLANVLFSGVDSHIFYAFILILLFVIIYKFIN